MFNSTNFQYAILSYTLLILCIFAPDTTFAATEGLPWESPLETIVSSLTGPVASAVAIIGIFVAGVALIFGGDLGEFSKKICILVLAISITLGAGNLITALFGAASSGALL